MFQKKANRYARTTPGARGNTVHCLILVRASTARSAGARLNRAARRDQLALATFRLCGARRGANAGPGVPMALCTHTQAGDHVMSLRNASHVVFTGGWV